MERDEMNGPFLSFPFFFMDVVFIVYPFSLLHCVHCVQLLSLQIASYIYIPNMLCVCVCVCVGGEGCRTRYAARCSGHGE